MPSTTSTRRQGGLRESNPQPLHCVASINTINANALDVFAGENVGAKTAKPGVVILVRDAGLSLLLFLPGSL